MSAYTAIRAARFVPWIDPGSGSGLYAPLPVLENATLLIREQRIVALGAKISLPAGCQVHDYGDVTIAPALINCHTHLQLSWLHGKTAFGSGFTGWLKSLVPHIQDFLAHGAGPEFYLAIEKACAALKASGCHAVADTGASLPGALSAVDSAAQEHNLLIRHFCEWFGFASPGSAIWPLRCQPDLANESLKARCAPCGHALYSTSAQTMRKSHAWCKASGRRFSFHLAESAEEHEMLVAGTGPLAEYYRPFVLPENWQPPRLSPFRLAQKLGLMDAHTLAVHGVWLEPDEIRDFAQSGAALCLCPRSNRNLGSGTAPVKALINSGSLLCLGTDGLSSCQDLDLRNEARALQQEHDLPLRALLRLASANGARVLNLAALALGQGAPACFSIWENFS